MQPRGNDPRIIQDKYLAGLQELQQATESTVFDLAGSTVQYHQTGLISLGRWRLRDQFRWQLVVEIGRPHSRSIVSTSASDNLELAVSNPKPTNVAVRPRSSQHEFLVVFGTQGLS
jgi:hypothetical protein